MKRTLSYIFAGLTVVAVGAYLFFFLGMAAERRHGLECGAVAIEVADSMSRRYITSKDVADCIRKEYGECRGMKAEEIELTKIEELLRAKNAVLGAEAYITPDGVLNVKVIQRVPVLRFRNGEEDFCIDGNCYVFHLQTDGTENLMTVGGHFPVRFADDFQGVPEEGAEWLGNMLSLTNYLKRAGMIAGVTINVLENGDVVIKPEEGRPQFIFGPPTNLSAKFARFEDYYLAIVPKAGVDCYSTVILKYNGQIVCRK